MKFQISAAAVLFLVLSAVFSPAQPSRGESAMPGGPRAEQTAVSGEELPVKSIVLFTNGVGYFRREGFVNGSGGIELKFNVKDISDLLKSLVLRDFDGGKITGVNYASRDPLERTLKSFSLDLSEYPGLPALLLQARGEKVEFEAEKKYSGTILGVETRPGAEKDSEKLFLTIIGGEGMQSVPFDSIRSVRFVDERLNAELARALGLIAETRNTDKKSVLVGYAGQGRRRIQAGYILETPVWKTSYRLVVGESGRHLLQGWAIVENTTDEDWRDIRLDLVAGAPVSFSMDLYQPLYNPRPFVPYSVQGNIASQTYSEGIAAAPAPPPTASASAPMRMYEMEAKKSLSRARAEEVEESLDIAGSVAPSASAESVGEFFRYAINEPVNLPRRRSAMIPLLNQDIEGERLSIYNEEVHRKHPMNGLRLKNTSPLNLMAGPLTVFEEGIYAGDARIDNLQPGAKRLVSFSMDLETEVLTLDRSLPELITRVRLQRGVLLTSKTLRKERVYTLVNRGEKSRTVLVEYPSSPEWKLVEPASFDERTEELYRFIVKTPAGKDRRTELKITEERSVEGSAALSNMSSDTILFYVNQKAVSREVKDALGALAKMKNELADASRQRQGVENQISAIYREQERIRGNMENLDRASALYQRYMTTLNGQENSLTALKEQLDGLQVAEAARKKAIDDFLARLDLQ